MQTDSASPELVQRRIVQRVDQRRGDLMHAADGLRRPVRTVSRAGAIIGGALPLLPYAFAAVTLVSIAASLLRGRRVRPALLIATGLDVYRLWRNYRNTTPSRPLAIGHARAPRTGA